MLGLDTRACVAGLAHVIITFTATKKAGVIGYHAAAQGTLPAVTRCGEPAQGVTGRAQSPVFENEGRTRFRHGPVLLIRDIAKRNVSLADRGGPRCGSSYELPPLRLWLWFGSGCPPA